MSVTLHTARQFRTCDGLWADPHPIVPGELYIRHVTFPGEEGHEEGAKPVVHHECEYCVNRRGDWVQAQYGVRARLGARITFEGAPGRIVNFANGHLIIRLDDGRTVPTHPQWKVTYEEAA